MSLQRSNSIPELKLDPRANLSNNNDGDEQKIVEEDHPEVARIMPDRAALVDGSINIYRRGHPLPLDLRARVMLYLQQGIPKQAIAKRLSISRSSVLRYQKASVAQNKAVPNVRPRGGYRSAIALLNREQVLKLGELLLQHPKLTIRDLKQLAVDSAILDPEKVPSDTTIWRAIRKLNLDFSKVVYVDPKGSKMYPAEQKQDHDEQEEKKNNLESQVAPASSRVRANNVDDGDLIAAERRAFRFIQKQGTDGQLNPTNLIFMDETNSRAFDQAHYAWGRKHQRTFLFRPKGMSATFNIIACIGVEEDTPGQMFLHYIIVPPRRDFHGVPTKWKPYEFRHPTAGIDFGYSVSQIRHLELDESIDLMKTQQIKIPQGFNNDEALLSELRRILVQVRTHGKVGMMREMPSRQKYLGGSIKAFRSTAADVVDYIERLMVPFYVKRKFHGLAHECNEDSDGIVGCPDSGSHFSVPYVPPPTVTKFQLLRAKQRTQRQWQRAGHRLLVYSRSKRSETEQGKVMLATLQEKELKKQMDAQAAADVLTRYERQLQRAGSYVPFQDEIAGAGYKRRLSNKYLVWDCASTHGAVRITSARKKSFWHGYAGKVGMKGVIFLPPRTPTLNPIELAFGFIKHQVRKNCPDEGYRPTGLIQAIHQAFRLVTPVMIKNWVKKAGYRFTSPDEEAVGHRGPDHAPDGPAPMDIDGSDLNERKNEDDLEEKYGQDEPQQLPNQRFRGLDAAEPRDGREEDQAVPPPLEPTKESSEDCYSKPGVRFHRKRSIVCMDEHGTVIREKKRRNTTFDRSLDEKLQLNLHWSTTINMQNIAPLVKQMLSVTFARHTPFTSEAEALADIGVTRRWSGLGPEPLHLSMPESITKVQDGTLWEIDGIVEHKRTRNGGNEYLVRYKGYGPEYDEWMTDDALSTATGAIKEYWARTSLRT